MELIEQIAKGLGFGAAFVCRPDPFSHYLARRDAHALAPSAMQLCAEPEKAYPYCNAIILLIWPYRPFRKELRASGYYTGSNAAYHAAENMVDELETAGIRSEIVYVPYRELAIRNGIATVCESGLTAIEPFGTRFTVQTLAAHIDSPVYREPAPVKNCIGCGLCQKACPTGALDKEGFHFERCVRFMMDGRVMPKWAKDAMYMLFGCELCQYACPYNRDIEQRTELPESFALERILTGDTKELLQVIGKNMKSAGRLQTQAAIIAAHTGRTDLLPLLRLLLEDPLETVRDAAAYAIGILENGAEQNNGQ